MAIKWTDDIDDILAGDLVAALAYNTPAGGTVVTPVCPLGCATGPAAGWASPRPTATDANSTGSPRIRRAVRAHTAHRFRLPPVKTVTLLVNGLVARLGARRAKRRLAASPPPADAVRGDHRRPRPALRPGPRTDRD